MPFDARKVRVLKLRPELLASVLRSGHTCEQGVRWDPIGPVPADLSIFCASYDHREQLIVLAVYSEAFQPVPRGIDPPEWQIAFTRTPPARVSPDARANDQRKES